MVGVAFAEGAGTMKEMGKRGEESRFGVVEGVDTVTGWQEWERYGKYEGDCGVLASM